MTVVPRTELARILGEAVPATPSSTRTQLPPAEFALDVVGVGRVGLPVSAVQAKQLRGLGRPARFGRGEQTLTDRQVRDTWEIPPELVRVEWSAAFESALVEVRGGLGLPAQLQLTAELHSVLVYEPGQFFVAHQDSEKDDAMVATLVVTLPSRHTGGELVVHEGDQATTYRGSTTKINLVAFYADCRHEVLPVSSGHRVTLTYNLLLSGDAAEATPPPVSGELAALLTAHFTERGTHRYSGEALDAPNRLVYLLDHQYTERGLSWSRLKGADARRARLLRAAAESAGCEMALALTEIQETWDALEPDTRYSRRRWSEDARHDSRPEDYELQYLIDSTTTLTRWSDPDGAWAEDISLGVTEEQACASTPTERLQPYESEFEGYMGNYGNTMDRWYRRAALLVWPRAASFTIRGEISPAQALDEVVARMSATGPADRSAEQARSRSAVATLAPFWTTSVPTQNQAGLLPKALQAAILLDDTETASMLLHPFRIESLQREHVAALAELARRHGEPWVAELVDAWWGDPRRPAAVVGAGEGIPQWVTGLPWLSEALIAEHDAGQIVGQHLLRRAWQHLAAQLDLWLGGRRPSYHEIHVAPLGEPLAAILQATATLGASGLRDQILADVCGRPDAITHCELRALRAASAVPPGLHEAAGFHKLVADCEARLQARLARPAREAGDWSVDPPVGCTCELCTELAVFLRDAGRESLDWPLAERRRKHVHAQIEGAELPVEHETRRQGRPFTLVLTKTRALFDGDRAARARDRAQLDWLAATWVMPAGSSPA